MVTKAIITSINPLLNKCTVRIPLFEHAGVDDAALAEATIITEPGINSSYKVNDVVYVGFESDRYNLPVVLGKLFLGNAQETNATGSAINCTSLNVTNTASIPGNTALTFSEDELKLSSSYANYKSITNIIDAINNINGTNIVNTYTTFCAGPVENLYYPAYKLNGFSAIPTYNEIGGNVLYYTILRNESSELTGEEMRAYMKYMSGIDTLPPDELGLQYYHGGFTFAKDLTVWYPFRENNTLKLIGVQTKTFEQRVKELIEESSGKGTVTNLQDGTEYPFSGGEQTDTESGKTDSSNYIDVIDLIGE